MLPPVLSDVARAVNMVEYGRGDEAKQLAGLPGRARCNLLSIGSRLGYNFEESVVQRTNCSVHVTDCTVGPPTSGDELSRADARIPLALAGRVRHWRFCLAGTDHVVTNHHPPSPSTGPRRLPTCTCT